MKTIVYRITDPRGIHARPAGQLVKLLGGYRSNCKIGKPDQMVDGKRLLDVMKLSVQYDQELTLQFEGDDEVAAAEAAETFLKAQL